VETARVVENVRAAACVETGLPVDLAASTGGAAKKGAALHTRCSFT